MKYSSGAPITEHPLFDNMINKLRDFRIAVCSCEAEISENARLMRKQIHFILCALEYFQGTIKEHSINDLWGGEKND